MNVVGVRGRTRQPTTGLLLERLSISRRWSLLGLGMLACVSVLFACSTGALEIEPSRALSIFWGKISGALTGALPPDAAILLGIRLPRVLFAVIAGAGLGVAGAVLQGLFRNPLADPGLIGVSSGAAAGAVITLFFMPFLTAHQGGLGADWVTALGALAGGLISVLLVYKLSTKGGYTSTVNMLLFGIAINTVAGSLIGVFIYSADEARLRSITLWMMGSLASANWRTLFITAGLMTACLFGLLRIAKPLNAFTLGEQQALHLGVPVSKLKRRVIIWATLAVASSVAFSGLIGFIGLVVPHLVRLLAGSDHRVVLPGSALMGASLLVLADAMARITVAPAELPIGLVTSILGAPFLIFLLVKRRGSAPS